MLRSFVALVLVTLSTLSHADTVGLHAYTWHPEPGVESSDPTVSAWHGQKKLWNNKTVGLYYVKDSGTPVLGDNAVFGVYCNSFSRTERNEFTYSWGETKRAEVQQSKCNITSHVGKAFTLTEGTIAGVTWDVTSTVELFTGYKKNISALGPVLKIQLHNSLLQMDSFAAPSLSARLGPVRLAWVSRGEYHLSLEHKFN